MPYIGNERVNDHEWSKYVDQQNSGGNVSEYPKMLYREGTLTGHTLDASTPLKIGNAHECETLIVESEDEELAALEDGWALKAGTAKTDAPRRGRPPVNKDAGNE